MMKELRRNEDQSGMKAGIIIFYLIKPNTYSYELPAITSPKTSPK